MSKSYVNGDNVVFAPTWRSPDTVKAVVVGEVTGQRGSFLVTKDADGVERKVRPGSCQPG